MNILYGVLILLGLGALLAIGIVLFSKIFYVKEDPRIDDVAKMLPGINCGACGKAGCRDLAEGLVKGEIKKVSQCKAGKKDKNYDPIIEYLSNHPDEDGTTHIPTI